MRPDAVHTSVVVGVAWMDIKLLTPTLYSGSTIPGGGPFKHTAPVSPAAARTLVGAFNSGFLMTNANGGYYTDGKTILPLRNGAPRRSSSTATAPPASTACSSPDRRLTP